MAQDPLISITIPTRNEEANIAWLVGWHLNNLEIEKEVIVVDDSDDNTAEIAEQLGATVVKGQGKGLGQAIIDGIKASQGEIVVVMDADLSHSPQSIPSLLEPILKRGYDMTIGSRYVEGGGTKGWSAVRKLISIVASTMALPITGVKDSTSGFFAFRKSLIKGADIKPSSWKIMLEVLIKANPTAVMEVPIIFNDRQKGKSKFTLKEMKHYLIHLVKLGIYKYHALIKFGLIGISGAAIHFTLLYILTDVLGLWYIISAILSIVVASTSNYILNHRWTFSDRAISNHLIGWFKYQVMSGITDLLYLGLLALFTEVFGVWYLFSAVISAGMVFPVKFVVASGLIWSKKINPSNADYEWNAYFKGSPIQRWWKRRIARIIWEWIPTSDAMLDYGCGSSPIITHYGNTAIGYDKNEKKIKYMQDKCYGIEFVNGTLAAMQKKYDHALCIEVIEHLNHPHQMMQFMADNVEINGYLVLATPDYSKPLWTLAEFFTPYKEEHIKKYTRNSLEILCESYGFFPLKYEYVAGCDLCELFIHLGVK